MEFIGKLILEAMALSLFRFIWDDSFERYSKNYTTQKALKLLSAVTVACILGTIGASVIIWHIL